MHWYDQFDPKLIRKIQQVEEQVAPLNQKIHEQVLLNQQKVLTAFRNNQVSDFHFTPSTGYGNDDAGRETLEKVYAEVFHTDDALVRSQINSGTHAITTALFGVLLPGDELLYITGEPYDTLLEVIGVAGNGIGSMREWGIEYDAVALQADNEVDFKAIKEKISAKTKVIAIQRSRGYAQRPSFTIAQIEKMITFVKALDPNLIVFVDNCYGEFSETIEPTDVGADLIAGSLIKNPGGGIAKTGGYIAGRADLIERCAYRLSAPGIGKEGGATLNTLLDMFQGFFLAPHVVGEAIKGAIYTAALLATCEVATNPTWDTPRTDLIQMISLNDPVKMVAFAQAIQKFSPINAHVSPVPSPMAGYEDEVIMAAGTFVQGASIELSIDGPMREPYTLYMQGGLSYEHVKLAVTSAVQETFFN